MKNSKSGYGSALSWLAGQARRCVKIDKAARIIYENDLPIDAAAALNEGFPTGLHLEELIAQVLNPRSAVEELRKKNVAKPRCVEPPRPPEDLSTVEELQAYLRRLPLHPTTKVSVWPCAVAVCAVYRGGPLQTRRPQPHSYHTRCRVRFLIVQH